MASKCMRGTFKRKNSSVICQRRGKEQKSIWWLGSFFLSILKENPTNSASQTMSESFFKNMKINLQAELCSFVYF